jgi:hypothetical protein
MNVQMVDASPPDRSDKPFGEAVLPWRAWRDRFVADAHGSQPVPDGDAVDLIPIADQVADRVRNGSSTNCCTHNRARLGHPARQLNLARYCRNRTYIRIWLVQRSTDKPCTPFIARGPTNERPSNGCEPAYRSHCPVG